MFFSFIKLLSDSVLVLFRYWRCDIQGASEGLLKGKTLGIKDNVCVAGVPMINGSKIMEGFIPDVDATLVTRILDAGKQIYTLFRETCMPYAGTFVTKQ